MNLPVYDFGVHIDRAVLCRHVDHGLAVLADLPDDIGAVGKPLRDVNAENRVGMFRHRQILRVAGGRRIQRSGGCDVGDNRTEVVVHDTAVLPGRTRSDLVPDFGFGFVFARQIFKGSAVVLTSLPPVMQILPLRFHGETIIFLDDDRY
ncbi:unknown [Clostridium sp. CAG:448]|nr:unknown [Clostridium sp. CAG:448]